VRIPACEPDDPPSSLGGVGARPLRGCTLDQFERLIMGKFSNKEFAELCKNPKTQTTPTLLRHSTEASEWAIRSAVGAILLVPFKYVTSLSFGELFLMTFAIVRIRRPKSSPDLHISIRIILITLMIFILSFKN
jgi:hypothetical protein